MQPTQQLTSASAGVMPDFHHDEAEVRSDLIRLCEQLEEPIVDTLLRFVRQGGLNGQDPNATILAKIDEAFCKASDLDPESDEGKQFANAVWLSTFGQTAETNSERIREFFSEVQYATPTTDRRMKLLDECLVKVLNKFDRRWAV